MAASGRKIFSVPALGDDFETWLREIDIWRCVTDLPTVKQGPAVYLSLEGQARNACIDVDIKDLNSEQGLDLLITKLKTLYAKDINQAAFIAYENFEKFKRPKEMSICEYVNEFERLNFKIKVFKMDLPDGVLAYRIKDGHVNIKARKLLDGAAKLMSVNIERGKEYLATVNQTHAHSNTTNATIPDHDAHNTEHVLKERNTTKKFIQIYDTISNALFDIAEPDKPPVVINTTKLTLIVGRISSSLGSFTKEVGSSGVFAIPELENVTDPNEIPVGYQIGEYKENPFLWSPSAKDIDIPVVSMTLKNANGDELVFKNVSTPFDIEVFTKKTPQYGNKDFEIELTAAYNFHTLEIVNSDSNLLILPTEPNKVPILFIKPLDTELTVQVLPLFQPRNLTLQDIEDEGYKIPIPASELKVFKHFKQDPHIIIFPEVAEDSNTTEFYVGISISKGQVLPRSIVDATGFDGDIGVKVHVELILSKCAFWDVENETWSQKGCVLTNFSTVEYLHCQCNHLTAFSGGVLITPNLLNPIGDAKLFLTFFDNPVVVVTIMVIWVLYIFLMCWARKEDEKDLRQRGVTVLEDNDKEDEYMYLVGVLTGWWRGAGTTSDVFLYLRGKHNQSSRHALLDNERPQFMAGSEDWFLLTTPRCIGPLKSVVVWHDNAGNSPSWFLKEVIVRDVQTGESWHCIYDNWLSVDRGPKEIRGEILAIAEGEISNQSMYQFYLKSSQDFRDGHLWASIFSKPITSNFTRCQRLTCALSLLITYMLANLMFLGIPDIINPRDQVMFDAIKFDLNDIVIGVETALVTFPINLILLQLFIRLSPRKQSSENKKSEEYYTQQAMREGSKQRSVKKKKEFKLPWWFLYVAWSVAIFSSLLCSYFVMLYGLKFGYTKSCSWLISFFTSFSQSAFITQPLKVVLIALIVTLILKRPANYTPTVPDDELEDNEEYLHKRIIEKQTMWEETRHEPQHYYIPPMSNNVIQKIQHRLRLQNIMRDAWREIFMYVMFVVIVFLTIYGHRDPHTSFLFSQTNKNMFIDAKYTFTMEFDKISTKSDYWNYTQNTLMDNIEGDRLIRTIDGTSYILGTIRMRQIRTSKDACDLPYYNLYGLNNSDCTASYWVGYDDTGFYNQSWNNEVPEPDSPDNFTEWCYQSSWQLSLTPFMGNQATYPGSGFVLEIPLNKTEAKSKLLELEKQNWIDDRTRAVFIEFTLYNPNENLFSVLILLVEFTNFEAVLPMYQIYTSTLYYYSDGFEIFVAVCEVMFIMFIIIYTYFEIKKLSIDVKAYFQDVWWFIELSILLLSYSAIGIYIQRILAVNSVLEQYKSSDGQSFLSFYLALSWDYSLQYVLASLVTVVIVKFFKLLRFNKNMAFLSKTLSESKAMLSGFTTIIAVATTAFGLFTFLVFGSHMKDYSSIWNTITTLFNFVLGVSDYYGLLAANSTLGPLYFFCFSLFFQYILMTMLLAIIITSFHHVRSRERARINELKMLNYLYDKWKLLVDG